MKTLRRPRRRFGIRFIIEGDTSIACARAASELLELLRTGPLAEKNASGPGWDLAITRVRDTVQQTDSRYAAQLAAYKAERAAIPKHALTADGTFRRRRKKRKPRAEREARPARVKAPKLGAAVTSAASEARSFNVYDADDDFDDP